MEQENLPLEITIHSDADNSMSVNISINGDLSFATVPVAYEQTKDSFANEQNIQVDLNKVQRADSSAMALILEWYRLAKEYNAKFYLLNIPPILKNIARVTDLEELL